MPAFCRHAIRTPHTKPGVSERLIERVDKLLYASKQAGRNRVMADCATKDMCTPVPCV